MCRRRLLTALVVSVLLGAAFPSIAGAVSLTWSVHAYQEANDVAAAPGGGVYVVGGRDTSITRKAFVARYTPGSTRVWTRSWLPNVDSSTNGVAVAVRGDGTLYVLGSVQQQCEGGGWFVRAYSPSGDLLDKYVTPGWQCSLLEHPTDLAVDGNLVVVTGFTHGCCADQTRDGWVQALSRSLAPRWRADIEPPGPTPASWFDTATGVAFGGGGKVFVAGWAADRFVSPGHESPAQHGTAIMEKLTRDGAARFRRRVSPPVVNPDLDVAVATGGGVVAVTAATRGRGAGWYRGGNDSRGWVGTFGSDGAPDWSRTWGTGFSVATEPTGVTIDALGSVWVSAFTRDSADRGYDVAIRRYTESGDLEGKTAIDAPRFLMSAGIAAAPGGAYAAGAQTDRYAVFGRTGYLWRLAV